MAAHGSFPTKWAWAVVVWALAAGPARADQLVGVVKSVDTEAAKFVVAEKTTDRTFDVAVTADTAIRSAGGRALTLKGLKKGDGVGITLFNGVATAIAVDQAPLLGVVESIDLDGKKFVLDEQGTDRDVTIALGPTTTIETPDGKLRTLTQLKTGDGVSVTFNGADVAMVVVNVKPTELTGHVKSVAADLKSIIITEVGTKTEVKVAVTPRTAIVTGEGKTLELRQLKKGDGVGIAHDASVASKIVVNPAPPR